MLFTTAQGLSSLHTDDIYRLPYTYGTIHSAFLLHSQWIMCFVAHVAICCSRVVVVVVVMPPSEPFLLWRRSPPPAAVVVPFRIEIDLLEVNITGR